MLPQFPDDLTNERNKSRNSSSTNVSSFDGNQTIATLDDYISCEESEDIDFDTTISSFDSSKRSRRQNGKFLIE